MRAFRTSFLFSLAIVASCLAPASAQGQNRTGTVEITPFGGGYFGGRLYEGSNEIFTRDVDVRTAGTYGLRVGVNVNRWLEIETGFSTARANIEARGSSSGLFGGGRKLGELDVKHYDLNGVFNFGRRRVIPYFTIGGGATTFRARVPGVDVSDDTRFTANMGLGVKVFFNPHVGLRFEGRGRSALVDDSRCSDRFEDCDDFRDRDRDDDRSNRRWYSSGELTGGVTVAF
ncbi:MAG: outer membrane beta-barrel protein [Thermoanaerobaculia bacterium]